MCVHCMCVCMYDVCVCMCVCELCILRSLLAFLGDRSGVVYAHKEGVQGAVAERVHQLLLLILEFKVHLL